MMVLVVVLMMMAVTKAAFIDKRPKMPRYPTSCFLFWFLAQTGALFNTNLKQRYPGRPFFDISLSLLTEHHNGHIGSQLECDYHRLK